MSDCRPFACVDLRDLPLQILRRDRPELRGHPMAVVAEDRPDAPLTHIDRAARKLRLTTGMRYGEARNLVPSLRAAPVDAARVDETIEELVTALQTFSPRVEVDERSRGTFYVDPSGLGRIYGDIRNWADAVHAYLRGRGFAAAVVVAHGRFAAFAIACTAHSALVIKGAKASRERLERVPLAVLGLTARLRDDLAALSVRTVGDLLGLPAGELKSRFGAEAARLQAMAADQAQLPMQPRAFDEPIMVSLEIEPPDQDQNRLLFGIKGALHELLGLVSARSLVLSALRIELSLEDGPAKSHHERIEPASPTRDAMLILDLVRLRLADVQLPAPVEAICLIAETTEAAGDQLTMFQMGPKRDLAAGERAVARVRAAFGEASVSRARLRDAHLPEARFSWEPASRLRLSTMPQRPHASDPSPPLVRRVLRRPKPLPALDRENPAAGPYLGEGEALLRLFGPYRVSGGWWVRTVERDYYYAETAAGELLWLFWDRPRRRWFLHGVVD